MVEVKIGSVVVVVVSVITGSSTTGTGSSIIGSVVVVVVEAGLSKVVEVVVVEVEVASVFGSEASNKLEASLPTEPKTTPHSPERVTGTPYSMYKQ